MNKKQLISLVIIFLILAIVSFIIMNKGNEGWDKSDTSKGGKIFKDFTASKVAKIAIKKGVNSVIIAKKDNNWVVETRDNYPANFAKIRDVTLKIKELKVALKVTVGKSQYSKLQLDENSATSVSFIDANNNKLATILLGKERMQKAANPNPMYGGPRPDGRYILVDTIDKPLLITEPLSEIVDNSAEWINKDFIKIENVKSMKLKQADKELWSMTKKDAKFAIDNIQAGEDFDDNKVSNVSSAVKYMTFNDVSKTKLENPYILTIETTDAIKYVLSLAKKDAKCYLTVAIYANFAEKRTPKKDEKKEDTEKLDKEFAENLTKLKEKVAKEQKFHSWTFEITDYKYNGLVKLRKDLIKEKKVEAKK